MIRRLIILLLIVGYVFGDTIKCRIENVTVAGDYIEKTYSGEYLGIYNNKVFVRTEKGEMYEIDCEDVIIIIKDDLSSVEWSCSEETYTPKTLTEADIKKLQKRPIVGGTLIGIGGALVFTTLGKECGDDCELSGTSQSAMEKWLENTKKFEDEILDTQKIGFGLIALGGILLAFGIFAFESMDSSTTPVRISL